MKKAHCTKHWRYRESCTWCAYYEGKRTLKGCHPFTREELISNYDGKFKPWYESGNWNGIAYNKDLINKLRILRMRIVCGIFEKHTWIKCWHNDLPFIEVCDYCGKQRID